MDQMVSSFWVQLFKLGIFTIFVVAIQEVFKGISAKGLKGIFKDFLSAMIHNTTMCKDTIQTINFLLALYICWVFDYGVMTKVIETGMNARGVAPWVDYVGTASVIYTGADQLFKRFLDMEKSWKEASNISASPSVWRNEEIKAKEKGE